MSAPTLADDLINEAYACPCDLGPGPCCARCECLVELIRAADLYVFEHTSGLPVTRVARLFEQGASRCRARIGGLRGLGYTLLGWGLVAYAVLHAACAVLRCAWAYWTGRIPPQNETGRKP